MKIGQKVYILSPVADKLRGAWEVCEEAYVVSFDEETVCLVGSLVQPRPFFRPRAHVYESFAVLAKGKDAEAQA